MLNPARAAENAYSLPAAYSDDEVAPLLCAGIIGYRVAKSAPTYRMAARWASTGSARPLTWLLRLRWPGAQQSTY